MISFIGRHFVELVLIWGLIFSVVLMGTTIAENLRERRLAAHQRSADQARHSSSEMSPR